jgi:site-specific recombinase XerD
VSDVVRFALARAGIRNPPSRGAHLLRHSAATAMLRAGGSLETIATVLRHRSLQTTAHYAKVDLVMLQQIAQPWPGGGSC